jgi:plastocyanin
MATFLGRALELTPDTPPPRPTTSTTSGDSTSTTDDGSSTSTTEDDGSTTTTAGQTTTTAGQTTTTEGSSEVVVVVGNNFFNDDSVTISVGDTVTFSKTGNGNHNVDFANNSIADSVGPTTAPFNHSVTFNSVGTFSYICDIHVGVGMDGTVTVE